MPHSACDAFCGRSSCRPRACRDYSSRLIIEWADNGTPTQRRSHSAGLSDRIDVLHRVTNLAAALCASAAVKLPHDWLHPAHNGNVRIGRNVSWSRYVEARRWHDGGWPFVSTTSEQPAELVLRASTPAAMVQQAGQLSGIIASTNRRFDWHLALDVWKGWTQALAGGLIDSLVNRSLAATQAVGTNAWWHCEHVHLVPAATIREAATKLIRATLGATAGQQELLALHLRRGDFLNTLNTSVPAVLEYVQCSASRIMNTSSTSLLVFTDEADPKYMRSLMDSLRRRFGWRVRHGDPFLAKLAPPSLGTGNISAQTVDGRGPGHADNFWVYAAAMVAMSRARLSLLMDRKSLLSRSGKSHLNPCGPHQFCNLQPFFCEKRLKQVYI